MNDFFKFERRPCVDISVDAAAQRDFRFPFFLKNSSKLVVGCLAMFLLVAACQNENTSSTTQDATPETAATTPVTPAAAMPSATSPVSLADGIQQEKPLTVYIKKKMAEKRWHFATVRIINQPEKSKEYKGKWIQFNPDNTLLSGFYEEVGVEGKWVYNEAKDVLTIMEGGERPSFSQWEVQFSSNTDDVSIWVGTARFQNNNTQMKMLRRAEKPKRG